MKTEAHLTSILKAISWRIFGTLTTFVASLLITGNLLFATTIGLSEFLLKIILYYLHERLWQVKWFRKKVNP